MTQWKVNEAVNNRLVEVISRMTARDKAKKKQSRKETTTCHLKKGYNEKGNCPMKISTGQDYDISPEPSGSDDGNCPPARS